MTVINDVDETVYYLYVENRLVATLHQCTFQDMFWYAWTVVPVDAAGDVRLRDRNVWEHTNFEVRNADGWQPNPGTFSGAFDKFVLRETDQLSFRSLVPRREFWLKKQIRRLVRYWISRGSSRSGSVDD